MYHMLVKISSNKKTEAELCNIVIILLESITFL